jgi:alanine racemase
MNTKGGVMFGTYAEINLDALIENYQNLRNFIPPSVKIAGVIKANAYGHDYKTVARTLVTLGVDYIAVATIREAVVIRKTDAYTPILVMGYTAPEAYDLAVKNDITLTMFDLEEMRLLNLNASYDERVMKIHIKIDTGFNRLGYKDFAKAKEDLKTAKQYEWLDIEGIFTHLALKNEAQDAVQMKRFDQLIKELSEEGIDIPLAHACDSIGAIAYPQAPYQMVRIGAALFGYCSRPTPFTLKPVMQFKSTVSHLKWLNAGEEISYDGLYVTEKKTRIATIPVGYADGLPRQLSNIGQVYVKGHKAPIVGLICMDQCMIDVTDIEEINVGDTVELFGENISLTSVAALAQTNRNELLSRIAMRVPRVIKQRGTNPLEIDYLKNEV